MILNSPYITGSLTVTGNTTLMGALTVTGSLSGTAATASFALTLGGTGSVGFATTGAFSATSGSAASRLTQIEQVYATTGSNSFRATQSITGSLTVTGQIIAQTLNVQQVTSSIVFSSGSNTFGCDLNSRQTFTGSVLMTGSLTVNTTGVEFQVTNTGINFGNLLTDTHNISGSLRITGSGNHYIMGCSLGIGTISPVEALTVVSSGTSDQISAYRNQNLQNSFAGYVLAHNNSAGNKINTVGLYSNLSSCTAGSESGDFIMFTRNAGSYAERMRITSGGDVFVNNSCGVSLNGLTNKLSVSSTTYNLFDISRFSDNAFGPNFYLVKSRNGTIGGNTIVANGDNLGNITWVGATGGTGLTDAANIRAEVDGTPGTNDMPGRLLFSTTADGASSTTERMRITSGGNVGINNPAPCARLHVQGNAALEDLLYFCAGGSVNTKFVYTIASGADDAFILRRNHTTQGNLCIMSWTYNGFVGVGTVTPSYTLHAEGPSNSIAAYFKAGGTAGYAALAFTGNGGSNIGVLTTSSGCIIIGRANGSVPNQFGANLDFLINCANGNILINSSLGVAGSVSKGSGSFRIKHPLASKKCTHQLVHSFIEGPQADLIYRGKTTLYNGIACVNIDCASRMTEGTFEALNRCSQVFTTNESSWDAIRGKLYGNILVIESQNTESQDEVSWMVIGERQDEHMYETEWTDEIGRVITEPEVE